MAFELIPLKPDTRFEPWRPWLESTFSHCATLTMRLRRIYVWVKRSKHWIATHWARLLCALAAKLDASHWSRIPHATQRLLTGSVTQCVTHPGGTLYLHKTQCTTQHVAHP